MVPVSDLASELSALSAETGHTWTARVQPELGTPAFLEGRTGPLAATPVDAERAARAFVSAHPHLFSLTSDAELVTVSSTTDSDGTTHARFQQREGRLVVWGSELLAHFDRDGALVRLNGRYGPVVQPSSLAPVVTEDAARVAAALAGRVRRPSASPDDVSTTDATLVLVPMAGDAGQPRATRLAWLTTVKVGDVPGGLPLVMETLVDADDGHVLSAIDQVQSMMGSGIGVFGDRKPLAIEEKRAGYWLEDQAHGRDTPSRTFSAGGRFHLPGTEVRSSAIDTWDSAPDHGTAGSAVDAHAHVSTTWDYFFREHGREGWLDDGTGIRTTVHYGLHAGAAFFDGTQLVFGDGNRLMTSPAASLDLVAHEYTHGIVASTSRLGPVGVPGAINEGLADLFGCLVSWDTGIGGRWQIGETIYHPRHRNTAIRDLADPHATGQPATLAEIDPSETDPHVSASIVGRLGYLLVEGSPVGPRPLGAEMVGQIFYRAMTTYLFRQAGWLDLADALLASTRDLAPENEGDVQEALVLVGIL